MTESKQRERMARERSESGQYVETVTLDDVLGVFEQVRGPVITSSDVASALDCTTEAARQKLSQLHDRGDVDRRKTGRTVVWWRTDGDGSDEPPDTGARERREEPPEQDEGEDTASDSDRREPASAPRDEPGSGPGEIDALVDEVADDVLPGTGEKLEERREALRAVVHYLREHGTATPKDFRRDVYPDHPARYTEGSDPPYSWWTNAMYEGMSELAERTDAVEAADSTGEWRWRGGR